MPVKKNKTKKKVKRKKGKQSNKFVGSKKVVVETPAEQRKKYPKNLIEAFVKISMNGWKNDKLYKQYRDLATKYLGKLADEPLERSKLVVNLTTATMDNEELQKKVLERQKKFRESLKNKK